MTGSYIVLASFQPSNYEAQLIEVHKAKVGYTPAQADAEFLSIAKDLSRYGEHLFLAKVSQLSLLCPALSR